MAFVEVIRRDLEPERAQQPFPADAEDDFLLQAQRRVAAIESPGDGAVRRLVRRDVGIQQQDRDRAAGGTFQHVQPRPHPDGAALDLDRDHGVQGCRLALRVPRVRHVVLTARCVQVLPQIAVAADQGDEHHRQPEIGRGPGGVAGEDAEPAAIGRHLRPDRDFHREIGQPRARHETVERRCPGPAGSRALPRRDRPIMGGGRDGWHDVFPFPVGTHPPVRPREAILRNICRRGSTGVRDGPPPVAASADGVRRRAFSQGSG